MAIVCGMVGDIGFALGLFQLVTTLQHHRLVLNEIRSVLMNSCNKAINIPVPPKRNLDESYSCSDQLTSGAKKYLQLCKCLALLGPSSVQLWDHHLDNATCSAAPRDIRMLCPWMAGIYLTPFCTVNLLVLEYHEPKVTFEQHFWMPIIHLNFTVRKYVLHESH